MPKGIYARPVKGARRLKVVAKKPSQFVMRADEHSLAGFVRVEEDSPSTGVDEKAQIKLMDEFVANAREQRVRDLATNLVASLTHAECASLLARMWLRGKDGKE